MALQERADAVEAAATVAAGSPVTVGKARPTPLAAGWGTIRTRLFAAFTASALATILACGIGIALLTQVGDLFDATVASGLRQFGGTLRLREQATQLANLTTAFAGAADRVQLDAAATVLTRVRATVGDELKELRDSGMATQAERYDAAFNQILAGFGELQTISARRIAAREPRVALSGSVLATTAAVDSLVNPRFFGETLDLAIGLRGDQIDEGADALAEKRAKWASEVERLQHMLQFRVATSTASTILAETSEVPDPQAVAGEASRFAEVAAQMERFRSAFGDDAAAVKTASDRLVGIGEGDRGLFALRRGELEAIAAEARIAEPTRKAARELAGELRDVVKNERAALQAAAARSHDRLALAQKVLLLIAVVSLIASLAIMLGYVGRRITGRLSMVTAAMTGLAAGDRSTDVPALADRDEIGDMARALQVFKDQAIAMNRLTERVTSNIRQVAIAATQASSAVGQVSDGSKAQLGALEQSAGALQQSAAAITDVAHSTERASEQARLAAALVASGITQMDEMVEIVLAISENSAQIRKIADAIAQIAAQTNMLSLNAAIEAARAGEHGRGFSVVAEEVRKLAENAGALAREIADQVRQSTEQADKGVDMVRQVSANMQALAGGVRQSGDLSNGIASAMSEQQAIVADINSNVAKLTRIGQANATAAEQITATMLDLSALAETTRRAVEDFNTLGVIGGQRPVA